VIEFPAIRLSDGDGSASEVSAMLAEKFFLVLETLISHASDDRSSPVVSSPPPQIPIKLPGRKQVKAAD
jgi:hypothetical protein